MATKTKKTTARKPAKKSKPTTEKVKAPPKKRKPSPKKSKPPSVKRVNLKKKKVKRRVHRQKLLNYLSNPELPWDAWPTRSEMALDILKISKVTFYAHFKPDEITDIESEALIIRMRSDTRGVVRVLGAQQRRAEGYTMNVEHVSAFKGVVTKTDQKTHFPPNPKSADIYLNRILGKVPDKTEHTGADGGPIDLKFTEEFLAGLDVDELKTLKKILEKNKTEA